MSKVGVPIVDSHVHVWRAIADSPAPAATIVSPASDVPIEVLDEYLSEHGVSRAVLVQPLCAGSDNRYVAELAARDPDKLASVCYVDPGSPEAAEQLRFWAASGCRGLRLRPRNGGEELLCAAADTASLWECAAELGTVVSVYADPEHLSAVAALATRFPTVAIVLDHLAHPSPGAGAGADGFTNLLSLAHHERVFLKISGYYYFSREPYPYRDCWDLLRALYDAFGPERLIWGSDFPHVLLKCGYRRWLLLQTRFHPFLAPSDLEAIMGGNASALYWPGDSAAVASRR